MPKLVMKSPCPTPKKGTLRRELRLGKPAMAAKWAQSVATTLFPPEERGLAFELHEPPGRVILQMNSGSSDPCLSTVRIYLNDATGRIVRVRGPDAL